MFFFCFLHAFRKYIREYFIVKNIFLKLKKIPYISSFFKRCALEFGALKSNQIRVCGLKSKGRIC